MNHAIIVAGGKGVRMGKAVPKQFLPVGGLPILMRTLEAFQLSDLDFRLILVIPEAHHAMWKALCEEYDFRLPHRVVYGGATRFESVKNGLSALETTDGVVCVHDGVRPFVSAEVIRNAVAEAAKGVGVIPVTPVVESLRCVVDDNHTQAVNRADYCMVQTPQVFPVEMLVKAYDCSYDEAFTDDASVVEKAGFPIVTIPGNRENIKITTPFDLQIAESLLKR